MPVCNITRCCIAFSRHLLSVHDMLLVDWLVKKYPTAKRVNLKRMVEEGRVRINGRKAMKLKQELIDADQVSVDESKQPKKAAAVSDRLPPFKIIYEDGDILVVYKEPGVLTSTVPQEPRVTILKQVQDYVFQQSMTGSRRQVLRVGLIHRLDKDAGGLLVFSKNDVAYKSLKDQFFEHTVERVYTAVVHGQMPEPKGRIRSRLVEMKDGTVRSIRHRKGELPPGKDKGEEAITEYLVLKEGDVHSLVRVVLHTGRKHQIRVHLSERGAPIMNDSVYAKEFPKASRLFLEATLLAFVHPTTEKRMSFEVPIPEEFKRVMEM